MFSSEKHGYNKKEVDKKINSILVELSQLKQTLIEKDKLNIALATALEKARQIEVSAQNLYELKIQKVQIICKNLEHRFKKLFKIYPQIQEFDDLKLAFDEFENTVQESFTPEKSNNINSTVNTENDTIRLLLGKMSTYSQPEQPQEKKPANVKRREPKPTPERHLDKFYNKPSLIRPIYDSELKGNEDFDSLADKFLQSKDETNSVYAKIINNKREDDLFPTPNESGFDLKQAVNPTEDLEEIMKAFNFDE